MSARDQFLKRLFDIFFSTLGIVFTSPLLIFCWLLIFIETGSNGFFIQNRIGRNGVSFKLYKLKTMRPVEGINSTITLDNDKRITKIGKFLRDYKIDELPQLINVFLGQMSFVGPRPDVAGYADKLKGTDRIILSVRPGITGPASIKYKNESLVLSKQKNPKEYNDNIIWPDKVKINKCYIRNWSINNDIKYIYETFTK